ncbi:Up-regulated during septation-domain-containing protein, partial [Halteromyces radiatus]|uniref:Up-regulated during septation-domain-containing protein n=1 Tax=Halteromyces radiatus TaxID=101107 RepID=UPI00221FC081
MNSIPIMPRQSNDGDRPSGLKFTRNNYYGFQRDHDSTNERNQGSSLFSSYSSKYTDNNNSSTSYSSNSLFSSRPSMDTIERPILPPAKDRPAFNNNTSTRPLPSVTSPTLPTRSPQRVRDSQTSTSQSFYSSTENAYSNNNRQYHPTSTSPIPSLSFNNNDFTSLSTTYNNSSSVYTESLTASSPPSRPRLSEARFSLTSEVAKMWRSQSAPYPSSNEPVDNKMMMESGDLLNELLVSRAILDSRDFKLLSFEDLDKVKQEYDQIKQQVEHSASRLTLEMKIRETARSLAYLNDSRSGHSYVQHQQEIKALDQKVDEIIDQHQQLKAKEHEIHCQLLEHMAGVLSASIRRINPLESFSTSSPSSSARFLQPDTKDVDINNFIPLSTHQELLAQLNKKEEIIKAQDNEIQSLKSQDVNNKETDLTKQEENQAILDHVLHQLTTMTKHYIEEDDDDNNANDDDVSALLTRLEKTLAAQKSRAGQLEREMESVMEKHRLEAMSEKKIEIQLRATQERRDAAEAKCQELTLELERVKSNKKSSLSELDRLKADVDNFSFNDSSVHLDQISNLESQLHQSEDQRQKLEKELSVVRGQLSDLEVETSKVHAEMASTKQREVTDQLELQHYRDEAFALRQEKNKWERMMKRQTVMQLMDEGAGGNSIKDKYEQQLEEQEQEYVAQLKEQKAYLDKTTREKDAIALERDQLTQTCHDLEELIRGKTRLLDTRDNHISELEAQIQELR